VSGIIKLDSSFYRRSVPTEIAKDLLGKILITRFDRVVTSGRIVETEAYAGIVDRASHAYKGRRTSRTEVMYQKGGTAYVYLCYGIHHLFNVVTNERGIPHAILIRALEPLSGIDMMLYRTGKNKLDYSLTKGPGNVTKALGLHTDYSGSSLLSRNIFIVDDGYILKKKEIAITPRIGVSYAGKDAKLPYRFIIKGSPYVSGTPEQNKVKT
jgi:DNA-3-methyladenine glycosylase